LARRLPLERVAQRKWKREATQVKGRVRELEQVRSTLKTFFYLIPLPMFALASRAESQTERKGAGVHVLGAVFVEKIG